MTARGLMDAGETPRYSVIVPSRTGHVDVLVAGLRQQSLTGWEFIVQRGISPPAKARNLGAARARGEVLLFLDDDIRLGQRDLLARLVDALDAVDPRSVVGVGWRLPPEASAFQRRLMQASFARPPVEGHAPLPIAWHSLGASCFAIRRRTFEALGGFDESLISGEDHELWYRLCRAGGLVYLLPTHWIYHAPPATLRAAIRKTIWHERGNAQVARKHPTARYRMALRGRGHAAAYLLVRTVALLALMVLKVSYRHRRPRLAWRPLAAILSYIGAWAYCVSWCAASSAAAKRAAADAGAGR